MTVVDEKEWPAQPNDDNGGGNGPGHSGGVSLPAPEKRPETLVVKRLPDPAAQTGKHDTILVSSSSKARSRIRVCLKCKHDNPPGATFCEGCGADLDELEKKRSLEESDRAMEKLARKAVKSLGDSKTIFRRAAKPVAPPGDVVVEKKKYHSQYIPPAAGADPRAGYRPNTYDPEAYRQPDGPVLNQVPLAPAQQYYVQPVPPQGSGAEKSQTSWIYALVIAAVLFLILSGLVAAIVVLALK
jgi:ribosomal protein L40E